MASTAPAQTPAASTSAPTAPVAAPPAVSPAAPVDVEAVLTELAAKSGQSLNWQTSIVDLMKLLGLDSSLANRKGLAQELHYSGD